MKHEEGVPLTDSFGFGWTGDVKYHLGAEHVLSQSEAEAIGLVQDENMSDSLKVSLAPNPSHLEFVNAVVDGMARAAQETRNQSGLPQRDVERSIAVVIHGDAAFSGEGNCSRDDESLEPAWLWRGRYYST